MEIIKIENDITLATLRKIYKTQEWYQRCLDNQAEQNQFLENLDNGFITKLNLHTIIYDIFKEKNGGGFRNSLDCFGTRAKKRFIRDILKEIYGGY